MLRIFLFVPLRDKSIKSGRFSIIFYGEYSKTTPPEIIYSCDLVLGLVGPRPYKATWRKGRVVDVFNIG